MGRRGEEAHVRVRLLGNALTDNEARSLRALADRVLTESIGVFVDLDDRNTLAREIRLARGVQTLLNERGRAAPTTDGGTCRYCRKTVPPECNACLACADERGP